MPEEQDEQREQATEIPAGNSMGNPAHQGLDRDYLLCPRCLQVLCGKAVEGRCPRCGHRVCSSCGDA